MDRDPGDFPAQTPPKTVAGMSEDEFSEWLQTVPPASGIRHIDDPDDTDEAAALADYAAGRYQSHATVSAWLATCEKHGHRSFRTWLAEHDG
ncbi:MAG: hypothetical protein ACK4ZY_03850 [Sphingomonas sp.]